jgi:hypothetical protein
MNHILVSWFYKLIFYRLDATKHCLILPLDSLFAEKKYIAKNKHETVKYMSSCPIETSQLESGRLYHSFKFVKEEKRFSAEKLRLSTL